MVMDHRTDEWTRRYWSAPWQQNYPMPKLNLPTQQEIDEFRRLLDKAREYDKRESEPDCEMDDKKRKLLDMARELGVDISFIEKE